MTAVLAVITTVCGIGWLTNTIGLRAVLLFMVQKGYTLPSDEETKACTTKVIRKMFGVKG